MHFNPAPRTWKAASSNILWRRESLGSQLHIIGIEIPGVVAVTVLTVLPLRRPLLVLAVSSILFYFNQYRQDKVQNTQGKQEISRNWPGVAWHLLLELQWFNPDIMENKEWLVDQSDMATSVVNVQESPMSWTRSVRPSWKVCQYFHWPASGQNSRRNAGEVWLMMAQLRRMWGKKWAQKGSTSHTHWLFFSSRNTMSPSRQLTIYMDDESMHDASILL